jgi:DNA-binding CsgD family transcriptional regulator
MADKMPENEVPAILPVVGGNFTQIYCTFQFDDQDCWIVEYDNHDDLTCAKNSEDNEAFKEICRFSMHGHHCALIQKLPDRQNGKSDLSRLLSARELQIATLVALGCPNKQIADKLHISEWTVATYLRRIFAKLQVDTRAAMTYRCASLICKQNNIP